MEQSQSEQLNPVHPNLPGLSCREYQYSEQIGHLQQVRGVAYFHEYHEVLVMEN